MVNEDYEYRGMTAAWDLLRGDYSSWPDRAFCSPVRNDERGLEPTPVTGESPGDAHIRWQTRR